MEKKTITEYIISDSEIKKAIQMWLASEQKIIVESIEIRDNRTGKYHAIAKIKS